MCTGYIQPVRVKESRNKFYAAYGTVFRVVFSKKQAETLQSPKKNSVVEPRGLLQGLRYGVLQENVFLKGTSTNGFCHFAFVNLG